ncbi:MAG: hypothetical protein ACJ72O_04795 [Marmoricola sp.]
MTSKDAAAPKHRSPKARWWRRSPVVPDPVWVPGWAAEWHVVEPEPVAAGDED